MQHARTTLDTTTARANPVLPETAKRALPGLPITIAPFTMVDAITGRRVRIILMARQNAVHVHSIL
jgi:hypothetical protein